MAGPQESGVWNIGDSQNQIVRTLASAATIAPQTFITHITGAVAIVTITPPDANFQGDIVLIADGAFTWTGAGNISLASSAAAVVGRSYRFTYDPFTGKWYPQGITS